MISDGAIAAESALLVVGVRVVVRGTFHPGPMKEATHTFIIKKCSAELAQPKEMTLFNWVSLADAHPTEFSGYFPIFSVRRPNKSKSAGNGKCILEYRDAFHSTLPKA